MFKKTNFRLLNLSFLRLFSDANNQQGGNGNNNNNNNNNNNGNERESDPYSDFQLDKCDTYENLWVWDAELYCSDIDNIAQCTCQYAQGLMMLGELQCSDIDSCPDDCSICRSCLTVMCGSNGSSQASKGNGLTDKVSTNSLVLICVGAGILIFAVFYLMARRNDDEDEDLSASLLSSGAGGENVWLVPDSPPTGGPHYHGENDLMADHYEDFGPQGGGEDDVWLAPVS